MPTFDPSPSALAALAAPAPRYTSYPSVPQWSSDPAPGALRKAVRTLRGPAAVYVHVPFCWKQCWYCGCNMVVAARQVAGERYLAAMEKQIAALPLAVDPLPVRRIHLGGGTPTWLSPDQLDHLLSALLARFEPTDGAELSIEVHPGVTSEAHLEVLHDAGFNRLSIGVQSVDASVLEAIGRAQTSDDVRSVASTARALGFEGINVDLVYGLPRQTMESFDRTLDFVDELRPDRLALYGYAHLPWLRKNQSRIDDSELPNEEVRMAQFLHATERLRGSGWRALGLDHFALESDPLAQAAAAGTLSRDFMGHTDRSTPLIGLGPSGISEIDDVYVQQVAKLGPWYKAIEGGDPFPTARTYHLSPEDELRRDAIRTLMSQLHLNWDALSARHRFDARTELADARRRLEPWVAVGAVELTNEGVNVSEVGRLLLKNLATCFDPSTDKGPPSWRMRPDGQLDQLPPSAT